MTKEPKIDQIRLWDILFQTQPLMGGEGFKPPVFMDGRVNLNRVGTTVGSCMGRVFFNLL